MDNINFKDIIELKIMIDFCRLYSSITGIIIDINDPEGNHPKKYYTENEENFYCRIIQSSELGKKNCLLSGKVAGYESGKKVEPYIHHCHAGLVDTYLPIFVKNRHIATLCTGQFLLNKPTKENFRKIVNNIRHYGIDLKKLEDAYFKTDVIKRQKLRNYHDLMRLIINYIFEMEDKLIFLKNKKYSEIVKKAISYIQENYSNKIYIGEVADKIFFNKYYLEHIFKKETGISFIEYLNKYRIEQVKNRLFKDIDIYDACFESGFNSVSHFYKIFKKFVGTSPNKYKDRIKSIDVSLAA